MMSQGTLMEDTLFRAGLFDPEGAPAFLRRGHFAFESGDHGDAWLELERLFTEPRRLQRAAEALSLEPPVITTDTATFAGDVLPAR